MKSLHFILRYTAFALLALICSCKEFIEPSITKRQLTLNAPSDNYQSTKYTVNLWWNDVDDALAYRLQVVTPAFDTIGGLILDTLVKSDKFAANLDPGQYQWRVRAENGSSQTAYSDPRSFTVLASSLTEQIQTLSSPSNNSLTNQKNVSFKWNDLYGATKFKIEIDTNNFADENILVYNQTLPGQQLNFIFLRDQTYAWRVRGENDTQQSKWSAVRYITFDATAPDPVTLTAPANGDLTPRPVALKWNVVNGADSYKLYVFKNDSTTAYSSAFPARVNTTAYSFNLGNPGEKIFWRVTAIDAAGNEGKSGEIRNFSVQ
jgi:hypothetical protein